jgi:hypothetical protein
MARRDHDFTIAQREAIIRYHNETCAACGADDALHADHWISGDSQDEGVCLCEFCNVKAKGAKYIPNKYRLPVRDSLNIVTHAEYKAQVKANREAFVAWANQFRFFKPGKAYNHRKIKQFKAPF